MKFLAIFITILATTAAQADFDSSTFEPSVSDYVCNMPNESEIYGAISCFNARKVIPFDSERNGNRAAEIEALTSDIGVCDCLKSNKFIEKNMARTSSEILLDNIEANANFLGSRLQVKQQAMRMQGWFMGRDITESTRLMEIYNPRNVAAVVSSGIETLRANIERMAPKFSKANPAQNAEQQVTNERINGIINNIKDSSTVELVGNLADDGNTCLPMRDFLHLSQMPSEKEFWSDLKNMNSFNPKEWRYTDLKNELNSLYSKENSSANEQKIRGIKARLTFLNKFPMYKHLFESTKGGFLAIGTGIPLHTLQTNLFESIKKNLAPKNDCYLRDMACAEESMSNGGFRDLKDATREMARIPLVVEVVREEIELDFTREVNNISNVSSINRDPPISQKALGFIVHGATNFNIHQCQGTDSPITQCIPGFATYCHILDGVKDRLGSNIIPDYESEWVNELESDPNKNLKYQQVHKALCEDMRTGSDGSIENFETYSRKYCQTRSNSPECRSRSRLLRNFLSDYPHALNRSEGKESYSNGFASVLHSASQDSLAVSDITVENARSVDKGSTKSEAATVAALLFSDTRGGAIANQSGAAELSADQPGAFTSALKGLAQTMENQNYQSSEDYSLPYQASSTIASDSAAKENTTSAQVAEVQKLKEEAQKDKDTVESELAETRRKLESAKEEANRSGLENRVKMLEQLLAQKDKTVSEYQKLFDKMTDEKATQENEKVATKDQSATSRSMSSVTPFSNKINDSVENLSQSTNRAPASVLKEQFSTGGSSSGNAAISSASNSKISGQSVSARRMNDALLSKYGITVSGSQDSTVLVAPDKDSRSLPKLSGLNDAKNLPLDVPRSQFEKFKTNDLDTLKDIYEEKVKGISGDVVKISVTTQGESESLEFYAIKEGGKIIFQPVRKARLNDLKLTLPST